MLFLCSHVFHFRSQVSRWHCLVAAVESASRFERTRMNGENGGVGDRNTTEAEVEPALLRC